LLDAERNKLGEERAVFEKRLTELYQQIGRDSFNAKIQDGRIVTVSFDKVVKAYRPNEMNVFQKLGMYAANVWEFITDEPREANTEGGVFPAIFGTVIMVMIMAVMVTPLGVIAAVYLREYAKQGPLTRTIRIAVNNLAGVPSIVYGVFGLYRCAVLSGGIARSRVRYAWDTLVITDLGDHDAAGGDCGNRRRPGAYPAQYPRRQSGAGCHQIRNAVAYRYSNGQPGNHDRFDPSGGARGR
jgi:hypothetical protein